MPDSDDSGISRRLLVKSIAGLGLSPAFSGLGTAERARSHVLGEFEDGLNGWKTNGGVELSRVSKAQKPHAVERGEYALAVDPVGDGYPVIENKERVKGHNFVDRPYLVGRIRTSFSTKQTTLTLKLRYHHNATPASGYGGQGGNNRKKGRSKSSKGNAGRGKPVLVEEKTLNVPFGARSTFAWDLSELADEKLRTPKRLEIAWYVGDTEPKRGPRGQQSRRETSRTVYFDTIRMTDSRQIIDRVALSNQVDELLAQHGDYAYETREFFDGGERGLFVFADGTEIPVSWEDIGPDKEKYIVDGTVYRLGGGWQ